MTTISDLSEIARRWFLKLAGDPVRSYQLDLNPVPASRPRVGRWGVYYSKTYKVWKAQAEKIADELPHSGLEGPLAILTEFVVDKPRTGKRSWPRGDGDNYEKAILDALNERVIRDDEDIVVGLWIKRYADPGEPCGCNVHVVALSDL